MKVIYSLLFVLLVSCTAKNTTPEGALKAYIKDRFSSEITSEQVSDFFVGPMFDKLKDLSTEELTMYFQTDGLKKRKLKILSKSCEAKKCFITYILGYDSTFSKDETYQSKVKKVVELWKEEGIWKIASINNIKTYHKSNQAINALE
jgi:hypothetical protein